MSKTSKRTRPRANFRATTRRCARLENRHTPLQISAEEDPGKVPLEGRVRVNGGARRRSVGAMGSGSRARSRGFKPRDNFAVEESHRVSGSPPRDASSGRTDSAPTMPGSSGRCHACSAALSDARPVHLSTGHASDASAVGVESSVLADAAACRACGRGGVASASATPISVVAGRPPCSSSACRSRSSTRAGPQTTVGPAAVATPRGQRAARAMGTARLGVASAGRARTGGAVAPRIGTRSTASGAPRKSRPSRTPASPPRHSAATPPSLTTSEGASGGPLW